MFLPDPADFLNVHFINLIQASTCLLPLWWYTDGIACSMLIALPNFQNLSEAKFVPASDIIFWGMPYSANIILTALVRFDDGNLLL